MLDSIQSPWFTILAGGIIYALWLAFRRFDPRGKLSDIPGPPPHSWWNGMRYSQKIPTIIGCLYLFLVREPRSTWTCKGLGLSWWHCEEVWKGNKGIWHVRCESIHYPQAIYIFLRLW